MEPLKRILEDPNAIFALVAMAALIKNICGSAANTVWFSRTKLSKAILATGKKVAPAGHGHTDTQ